MSYQLSITDRELSEPHIVNINISPSQTKRTIQNVEFFQTNEVFDALCQDPMKRSQKRVSTQISAVIHTKDENDKDEVSVTKLILKRKANPSMPVLSLEKIPEDQKAISQANLENLEGNNYALTVSTRNLDEIQSSEKKKITLSPGKKFNIEIQESADTPNFELFPVAEGENTPEDKKEEEDHSQREDFEPINDDATGHNIPLIDADHVTISVQDQTPNNNAVQAQNTGNAQTAPNPNDANLIRIKEPEIRIYLARENVFYLMMIIFSALLQIHMSLESFEALLIPVFIYLIATSLIDVFWKMRVLADVWLECDETYKSGDSLVMIIALTFLNFRITGILPISIFACLPFMVLTASYIVSSKACILDKAFGIILRIYYTVQILLISLKLDGNITWGWVFVLMPTCGYIGVKLATVYNSIFMLLIQLVTVDNMTRKFKVAGFFWALLHGIQNFVLLGLFLGAVETLHSAKNIEYLHIAGYVSFGVYSILLIYTNLAKKHLIKFIAIFDLVECQLAIFAEMQNAERRPKKISFEVEKKNSYFVMLSSTYFKPLQNVFSGNGKDRVEKAKHMLSDLKIARTRSGASGLSKEETRDDSVLDIQTLRQYKLKLDRKFSDMEKPSAFSRLRGKGKTLVEVRKRNEENKNDFDNNDNGNLAASLNDLDEAHKLNNAAKIAQNGEGEENLCYVCYANPPDAIMISCGHGGICYDCATATIKVKDECLECRGKVQAIYRVDPNPKLFDIVKGVELKKIVTSDV